MDDANFGVFGNYYILRRESGGELAEIFLARSANRFSNGKLVQLKRLASGSSDDLEISQVFLDEGRKSLGLNHSNIVESLELGTHEQKYFLVMEYVEGKTLDNYAQKIRIIDDLMPVEVAVFITAQIAAGLHFGHQFKNQLTGENLKLVHGRLSPASILLSYSGEVKLTYFGISPFTLSYSSPEQVRKEQLEPASDQFSLGVILWELLTGLKLFHQGGSNQAQIKEAILNCGQSTSPPSQFRSEIPPSLNEIVSKALAYAPQNRYPSSEAFESALTTFLHREHPSFSSARLRESLKTVFEDEIEADRSLVCELNFSAQEILEGNDGKTKLIQFPPLKTVLPVSAEITHEIKKQDLKIKTSILAVNPPATPHAPPTDKESVIAKEPQEIEEYFPAPDPFVEDFSYPKESLLKRNLLRMTQKQRTLAGLVTAGTLALAVVLFMRTSDSPLTPAVRANAPALLASPRFNQLQVSPSPATIPAASVKVLSVARASPSPEPPMEDLIVPDPVFAQAKTTEHKTKKRPLKNDARRTAKSVLSAKPAAKPVQVLLHIRITLKKGPSASALLVNNINLDLKKPYVRVLSDQKILVQVQRKGLKPLFKVLLFDSRQKLLPSYDLDINLY